MKVELTDWNVEDHLTTAEDRAAYIQAAAEEGTPDAIPDAFGDVFRSLGMSAEAAICDGLAGYLRATAGAAIPAPQAGRHKATRRKAAKRELTRA